MKRLFHKLLNNIYKKTLITIKKFIYSNILQYIHIIYLFKLILYS